MEGMRLEEDDAGVIQLSPHPYSGPPSPPSRYRPPPPRPGLQQLKGKEKKNEDEATSHYDYEGRLDYEVGEGVAIKISSRCGPRAEAKNKRLALGLAEDEDYTGVSIQSLPALHQLILKQDVDGIRTLLSRSSSSIALSEKNQRTGATSLHVCALLPPSSFPLPSSTALQSLPSSADPIVHPRDVIADLLLDLIFESPVPAQILFDTCHDIKNRNLKTVDGRELGAGESVLHIAARNGFDVFIRKVFERVFKLRREEALTPRRASDSTLVDWDGFVNGESPKGQTALHVAAKSGQYDCCMTLVTNGAAVDWEDAYRRTAYDLALLHHHDEVVKLLRIEGATIPRLYQDPQQLGDEEKANMVVDDYGWIVNGDPERGPTPRSSIKPTPRATKQPTATAKRSEKQRKLDAKRTKKWEKMLKKWNAHEKDKDKRKKRWKKVQKRARKGIPPQVRGQAWIKLTGAHRAIENPPIKYEPEKMGSRFLKQIDLDIARTHRGHILYKARYSEKQCQLFRLLRAYSLYNKAVGYTQGMSSLVATLLTFIDAEEEAFWAFDSLMKHYAMSDLYRPGFPGLKKDFFIHEQLLSHFLPRLHAHFEEQCVITSAYATKWFLMIFMNLSYPTTVRLWDYVFCEGYRAIFFVAISLLQELEDELLGLDMEGIFVLLGAELSDRQLDPDRIIRGAVKLRRKAKKKNYALFRHIEQQYAKDETLV